MPDDNTKRGGPDRKLEFVLPAAPSFADDRIYPTRQRECRIGAAGDLLAGTPTEHIT